MTEPTFLLDSNILIYLLRGICPEVKARVEQCDLGQLVTSSIAFAEVMRKVPEDELASYGSSALFDVVSVLPFDARAALAYRHAPFRRGRFDRLIAAHALALSLTIVTNNESDFDDVPGLKLENWTLP